MAGKRASAVQPMAQVKMAQRQAEPEPLTMTIEQAARRIGVGKSVLYPHVMCGNLPSVVLGKTERRVLASKLPAFLEWLWEQQREELAAS